MGIDGKLVSTAQHVCSFFVSFFNVIRLIFYEHRREVNLPPNHH